MNKISDKLFLGNLKAASDLQNLKKNVRIFDVFFLIILL